MRNETALVRQGLKRLCSLFERIDAGEVKIDIKEENGDMRSSKLSDFTFSATIGFGIGFFEKTQNKPKALSKKVI